MVIVEHFHWLGVLFIGLGFRKTSNQNPWMGTVVMVETSLKKCDNISSMGVQKILLFEKLFTIKLNKAHVYAHRRG